MPSWAALRRLAVVADPLLASMWVVELRIGALNLVATVSFVRIIMQHRMRHDLVLGGHVRLPTFMLVGLAMTVTRLVVAVALLALQRSTTIALPSPGRLFLRISLTSIFVITPSTLGLSFVALFVVARALIPNTGGVACASSIELRIVVDI